MSNGNGNGWGGERDGAGRPTEFDQRLLVRLTAEQREALTVVQAQHKLASVAEAMRWLIDTYNSKGGKMKAVIKVVLVAMMVGSSACAYLRPAQPVYMVQGYGYNGGASANGTSGQHGGHGGGGHGGHR